MKRDMELIRAMILAIEEHSCGWAPNLQIKGYTAEQIGYHAYLLVDSSLAAGADVTSTGSAGPHYKITRLTSAGHDFAESARNKYIWDEVREDMKRKGILSATIDVIKKMLDKQIRKRLDVD